MTKAGEETGGLAQKQLYGGSVEPSLVGKKEVAKAGNLDTYCEEIAKEIISLARETNRNYPTAFYIYLIVHLRICERI